VLRLLRLLAHLATRIAPARLERWAGWLAFVAFSLLRIRRRVAVSAIERSLRVPRRAALALARRAHRSLCLGGLELLRVGALDVAAARALLGSDGIARLERLLAAGRGLLVLSAHLGSWDLLACAAARCGFAVNVVTRELHAGWLNHYWMETRRACGVRLLPARGSAHAILRALRRGEIVALLLDQHQPGGLVVPFFERPAATSDALARLARSTRAPVVPAFLLRAERGHCFVLGEPLPLWWTADRRADLRRATALFTARLEQEVRAYPSQWLWVHRRWKASVSP
jgi:KDO2-lipid IV(A) lauroyltransferase